MSPIFDNTPAGGFSARRFARLFDNSAAAKICGAAIMVRRNRIAHAALTVTFIAGCNRPSPAILTFVDIGIDEDGHPNSLAVMIENTGGAPATLTTAKANVGWKYLISGNVPTIQLPARFDYDLTPTGSDTIGAESRQTLTFDFNWNTAADDPPMIAVVHATLTLQFDGGQSVETIPLTFLIRSWPDIGIEPPSGEQARELADKIGSFPGWKSPATEAIVNAAE